jgi:ketosteroid isomerase-like protein
MPVSSILGAESKPIAGLIIAIQDCSGVHMSEEQTLEAADKLFSAIEKGEVDAIRAIYTPKTVIWHNNDQKEQTVEENLAVLGWVVTNIKLLRYTDIKRQLTATGFVQQHILRGRFRDHDLALPACIIAVVEDGHITRIDEYLDSAHTAVLRG